MNFARRDVRLHPDPVEDHHLQDNIFLNLLAQIFDRRPGLPQSPGKFRTGAHSHALGDIVEFLLDSLIRNRKRIFPELLQYQKLVDPVIYGFQPNLTNFLLEPLAGEYGVSLIFAVPGRIQDIHQTDRHAVYRSQNCVDLRRFLLRLQHHSFLRKQRSRQQKEDRNAPAEFHFIIPSACCAATRREERRVPRQHSCCPDSPFRARRYRRQFHDRDSCGSPASRESNSRRNQTPAF